MDCKTVQRLMDDFRAEALAGELDSAVRGHLGECKACRELLRNADILERRLRLALAPVEPPEGFAGRVRAALYSLEPPAAAPNVTWLKPALLAAAACVVVSLCAWYLAARPQAPLPPKSDEVVVIMHDTPLPEPKPQVLPEPQPGPQPQTQARPQPQPVKPRPQPQRRPRRDKYARFALGKPFVIAQDGVKPYDGPTHIRIIRTVKGVPELIVDAFPEG